MNQEQANNQFKNGDIVTGDIGIGDIITFANTYERRTFWEWLSNQPKRLKQFKVISDNTARDIRSLHRLSHK